jgi:hypothetical protein
VSEDKITDLELARQIKALDTEMQPERDLWVGVQRQILDHPQKTDDRDRHFWMPYAVAASLVIAVSALMLNVAQLDRGPVLLTGQPVALDQIESEYVRVRNPMMEQFTRVNQSLDERARTELYRNLEIIEKARSELEIQLRENPDDHHLMEMFMKVQEQELDLLRRDFSNPSTSM